MRVWKGSTIRSQESIYNQITRKKSGPENRALKVRVISRAAATKQQPVRWPGDQSQPVQPKWPNHYNLTTRLMSNRLGGIESWREIKRHRWQMILRYLWFKKVSNNVVFSALRLLVWNVDTESILRTVAHHVLIV